MAIEIRQKSKIQAPVWSIIVGAFSGLFILGLVGTYFYLNEKVKELDQKIEDNQSLLVPSIEE
ncbi:MAG TPA: hypothetical protein ENL27_02885, partial [Candidatus Parcubacteria bacterium]|nr:hypothetical protein [Candidatus Parcubacteria bacterium]